ncbi:hypothetical protein B0F90DRAFT_1817126 [Multifurca ochricompacta]|uniref:Uncharacterized protein n=1 Tax=Multifurca ochricompacta TaxID=376703 RepID=A0AAD4M651_9AGAM|nr:hypothetical protein B0F90DRAFT_1817126 [Multifurca ochricompacta]
MASLDKWIQQYSSLFAMGESEQQRHPFSTYDVPVPGTPAPDPKPKPIALGTYIVFAHSPQPTPTPSAEKRSMIARRHRRDSIPPSLALPIAGPTEVTPNDDASTNTSVETNADVLRVEPGGQSFPWDGCVQWTTHDRSTRLRVISQHDVNTTSRKSGRAQCKLTNASLLRFAEAVEEECGYGYGTHEEAAMDDIAEAIPAEIWFDLGIADINRDIRD